MRLRIIALGLLLSGVAVGNEALRTAPRLNDCYLGVRPALSNEECVDGRVVDLDPLFFREIEYGTHDREEVEGLPRTCADITRTTDMTTYTDQRTFNLKAMALRTCATLRFLKHAKAVRQPHLADHEGKLDLNRVLARDFTLLQEANEEGAKDLPDNASYALVNKRMSGAPDDTSWTGRDESFGFLALGDVDDDGLEDGLVELYSQAIGGSLRASLFFIVSRRSHERFYSFREFDLNGF